MLPKSFNGWLALACIALTAALLGSGILPPHLH